MRETGKRENVERMKKQTSGGVFRINKVVMGDALTAAAAVADKLANLLREYP